MTKKQKEIIVGKILGDGHLETQTYERTYRLKIEHSLKQKEYVDYLYEELKSLCQSSPKLKTKKYIYKNIKKDLSLVWFNTKSSGDFRFFAQQFYKNKKKIIPKIIKKLLTPVSIAIWFMDDGSFKSNKHNTFIIHTNGYQKSELELIQKAFLEKFGIKIGIHKQYDNYRLYVYSESSQEFINLIKKYIIPSMTYKLGNTIA